MGEHLFNYRIPTYPFSFGFSNWRIGWRWWESNPRLNSFKIVSMNIVAGVSIKTNRPDLLNLHLAVAINHPVKYLGYFILPSFLRILRLSNIFTAVQVRIIINVKNASIKPTASAKMSVSSSVLMSVELSQ